MRKSIQDVYTEMYSSVIEESREPNINDYRTMVYNLDEASGHGDSSKVKQLLKLGYKKGLIDYKDIADGYFITSNANKTDKLTIHRGESALHPLRRFLQNLGLRA